MIGFPMLRRSVAFAAPASDVDLMVTINSGGVVKTARLVDFSAIVP